MDLFRIEGCVPLRGQVTASGSKNSVLALMTAALVLIEEGDAHEAVRTLVRDERLWRWRTQTLVLR